MYELTLIALIVGTFVSTNVDNLAILVSWLLSGRVAHSHVAAGYALSVTTVIFISAVLGLSSKVIPVQWIGWLGVVPILLGAYALASQFRGKQHDAAPEVSGNAAMFGVAATMIANTMVPRRIRIISQCTPASLVVLISAAYLICQQSNFAQCRYGIQVLVRIVKPDVKRQGSFLNR